MVPPTVLLVNMFDANQGKPLRRFQFVAFLCLSFIRVQLRLRTSLTLQGHFGDISTKKNMGSITQLYRNISEREVGESHEKNLKHPSTSSEENDAFKNDQ